jgi:5-hydroxyisourate hydrolase
VGRISTHVLDMSLGRPGSGVNVTLEFHSAGSWRILGSGTTNEDGRIGSLLSEGEEPEAGVYRATFETGAYHRRRGQESLYPQVVIVFEVTNAGDHYHIPLLLDAYGYTTYRGS